MAARSRARRRPHPHPRPRAPFASALAVKDGVIVAVGDTAEVRAACDASTTAALRRRAGTSRPGSSTGTSTCSWAPRWPRASTSTGSRPSTQVRALLRAERERVGPDAWITGFAFEYAALEGADYHHDLIDEAAGPGPMLIHTLDMHTGFANAERAAHRPASPGSREFEDGSFIVVDDAGRPTGELREMAAIRTVWDAVPEAVPGADPRLGRRGDPRPERRGHHRDPPDGRRPGDGSTRSPRSRPPGCSTCGCASTSGSTRATDPEALAEIIRRRDLTGSTWTANSVKFMVDGVIDTGTAWLEEPDTHGDGNDPMWPDTEHFRRTIKQFHDAGFHIATHAIGDRAIREVLDAYAAAGGSAGRHRIEHIETPRRELLARFRREGVSASMQPIHLRWLSPDLTDPWSERLGVHRCAHTMPSGDIVRARAPTSCSGRTGRSRRTTRAWASSPRSAATPPTSRTTDRSAPSRALTGLETLTGYTANAAQVDGGDGRGPARRRPRRLRRVGRRHRRGGAGGRHGPPGPPDRGHGPHGPLPRVGARRVVRGSGT